MIAVLAIIFGGVVYVLYPKMRVFISYVNVFVAIVWIILRVGGVI